VRTGYARYSIVLVLILATGLAAAVLRVPRSGQPSIPSVARLTSGTGWTVTDAYAPAALPYRQWQLFDGAGHEALLYVGASSRPEPALVWTGELGYQGAGYEVSGAGERQVKLSDGSLVTVNSSRVQHLTDARLIEYAVASPRGLLPHRLQSIPESIWAAVGGDQGPYYMVRVSVPVGTSEASARQVASTLMGSVLPKLLADAQNA
jgi:hypothetical protein